jgi:hypothetical protein
LREKRVLESSKQLEHRSIDHGAFLLPVEVFDAHGARRCDEACRKFCASRTVRLGTMLTAWIMLSTQ